MKMNKKSVPKLLLSLVVIFMTLYTSAQPPSNFDSIKVDRIAKNIFFATGSYKLLPKSNPALNSLVQILNDNPAYKVRLEYKGSFGASPGLTAILSEARAKALASYLVSAGIDDSRVATQPFESDRPISKTSFTPYRRLEIRLIRN